MLTARWLPWIKKRVMCHVCFQIVFSNSNSFGSESGCLGLENQALGTIAIAKQNVYGNGISHHSRFHFSLFGVASGPIFMICGALEIGLKFDDSSG